MKVAHLRLVRAGGRKRGDMAPIYGTRVYITHPDHEEVEFKGLKGWELEESVDFKRDNCSLVVVRDVEYQPRRWSWEVEKVCDAPLDDLPVNLSPQTRRWLNSVGPLV